MLVYEWISERAASYTDINIHTVSNPTFKEISFPRVICFEKVRASIYRFDLHETEIDGKKWELNIHPPST